MRDGLYRVRFRTRLGSGTGVAALHHGLVCGGDRGMTYSGSFDLHGDALWARVTIAEHAGRRGPSVFGVGRAIVALRGKAAPDSAELAGASPQAPGILFRATLTRLPD